MKIKILVTLDVEHCEGGRLPTSGKRHAEIVDSVSEAIENALKLVQSNGFSHAMQNDLSIMVAQLEIV